MNLTQSTTQLLREHQAQLAQYVTDKQLAKLNFSPAQRQASLRDANYNIQYLADAIELESALAFRGYILWLRDILKSYGLPGTVLTGHLSLLRESISALCDKEQQQLINTFIEEGLTAIYSTSTVSARSHIEDCGAHAALAKHYLQALLEARKEIAVRLIMDALNNNTISIKELYIDVFTNVLYEIGRLWQTRKISVAQEHYASAVTQYIISLAYDRVFSSGSKSHRMIGVCIGDELHEIGIRMVCDTFELSGWDSHYLGANVPTESIISEVGRIKPHVLAISATLIGRISLCTETISALKTKYPSLVILVGGGVFSFDPELWRQTGAHGYSKDAVGAVALANQLVLSHD